MATTYHLAPALVRLRDEIDARWPQRDRTSDGWIGDAAHQQGASDHNPDADNRSVNALDIDKDGVDMAVIIDCFERHPSAHYWICNRQIADRDDGWRRRPYTGSNPHDKHGHLSIKHGPIPETDPTPWGIAQEEDMATPQDTAKAVADYRYGGGLTLYSYARDAAAAANSASATAAEVKGELAELRQAVDQLAAQPVEPLDYDQLALALLRNIPTSRPS